MRYSIVNLVKIDSGKIRQNIGFEVYGILKIFFLIRLVKEKTLCIFAPRICEGLHEFHNKKD